MSQDFKGVNNFTDPQGPRNSIEDYTVAFRTLFSNEGVISGLIVTQTSTPSPAVNISGGYMVIDCGGGEMVTFRLKTAISSLAVPNTGSAKYYLVVAKVDLDNAGIDIEIKEGTTGQDPTLTEGGSPRIYYIVLARINKTATVNVINSEIIQDGVTLTNNATPEIIYRTVASKVPNVTSPIVYNAVTNTLSLSYTPENLANKGIPNGYAGLDNNSHVPTSQLPNTDGITEGSVNLFITSSRVLSTVLSGLNLTVNQVISSTDSIILGFGKTQKQISDNLSTLNSHISNTSNPHSVTKSQVGLGNVDNTSDSTKNSAVAVLTNKDLTSITNTFPTFNQNTTGSAAKLTTPRNIDGQAFDGSADITVIAPGTHAATSKTTPVDADELSLVDSAASNILKKLTWANLKATSKTYFDSVSTTLTNKTLTAPVINSPTGIIKGDVGLGNVDNIQQLPLSYLDTDTTLAANSDIKVASQKATKTYIDNSVVGLLDDRGNYDASGNVFPSTGGSGSAGAVVKGDIWFISVAGTLGGQAVNIGDQIRALTNTPGQTAGNWAISEANIGYVPENVANKENSTLDTSSAKYPTNNLVKTYVDAGLATKQNTLTIGNFTEVTSSVLTISGGTNSILGSGLTVQVKQSTTSQSGFLSGTDWNTFNNKQAALGFTAENVINKATDFSVLNNTKYPTTQAVQTYVGGRTAQYYIGKTQPVDYLYSTDVGINANAVITQMAINSIGGLYYIQNSDTVYNQLTTINQRNQSNITIKGGAAEKVRLFSNNVTNFVGINSEQNDGNGYRYKHRIEDIVLDNSTLYVDGASTQATGAIALKIGALSDSVFQNSTIRNYESGMTLTSGNFYNNFWNIKIENTRYPVLLQTGTIDVITDKPNTNHFWGSKFLNSDTGVNFKDGNNNVIFGGSIEDFNIGFKTDGIGNALFGTRLESNDRSGNPVYAYFDVNSVNNSLWDPYVSGNNFIDLATSFKDYSNSNTDGNIFFGGLNNITVLSTFKDQYIKWVHNAATQHNFIDFVRTSSGYDGYAVLNLRDEFTTSGNPETLRTLTNRTSGYSYKALSGITQRIKFVINQTTATPPGSPATGDRYIVATSGTGAWSAKDTQIAEWNGSAWIFTVPSGTSTSGIGTYVQAETKHYFFNGTSWVSAEKFYITAAGLVHVVDRIDFENLTSEPGSNPTASVIYTVSGILKYRGAGGDGGAGGNRFLHNRNVEVVGSGTAYTLTTTSALTALGTTTPSVSIPSAGQWFVTISVRVELSAATYTQGDNYVEIKLRNSTDSTDISNSTYRISLDTIIAGVTLQTGLTGEVSFPVAFSLSASKTVQIWAKVNNTPSAGNVIITAAKITGFRMF